MGVKDLWKLLEPAGRPVKLETLEGLVVGVGKYHFTCIHVGTRSSESDRHLHILLKFPVPESQITRVRMNTVGAKCLVLQDFNIV